MICGGMARRKVCEESRDLLENSPNLKGRSLLSPLKSLQLSPIPRTLNGGMRAAKDNIKPMSLKGRGQLKISIYVNAGLLTIHVIQAKDLRSSNDQLCSSFVRVCVVPDVTKKLRCKTDLIHHTNSPIYDQKFSYELQDNDRKKRIFFSVWNKNNKKNDFIGSMSFGIQSVLLKRQSLEGWYYLLPEEYGVKKHLQVMPCRKQLLNKANTNIHRVNKDLRHMQAHTFVIRKEPTFGYGFSLTGNCPVKIGRIESDSPADVVGLQMDDCVVRLNGLNVSRSTAESVAKLVRNSEFIAVEIQRPLSDALDSDEDSTKNFMSSTLQSDSHVTTQSDENENQQRYYRKGGFLHVRPPSAPSIQRAF